MKNLRSIDALLKVSFVLGVAALTGCPTDPGEEGGTSDTTAGPEDTVADTVVDPSTSSTTADDRGSTSESGTTVVVDEGTTEAPPDPFVFPDDPYDAYTQIDRHGAVEAGTAGILASQGLGFNPGSDISLRDAYNASSPLEDEGGMWLDEIVESVTFFHDALDDDLGMMGLGLDVATVNEAVMQAGPVIVPDTIKYDPAQPTAYPNGRNLQDQVVDITFAAVLLDLGTHGLDTFALLPLNPVANDVGFGAEFPYLAPPHPPM
jgi:hypothetical protein